MKRLAIVGAGITGLTAASELAAAGHDVTVFEASDRVGGAIRTIHCDGWLVEAGPNTALLRDASLDPLLARAGLGPELQVANPAAAKRFIVRYGRPNALPANLWQAITTPVFNFRGKLRVLAEPFIRQNRNNPDETLASFARRRVGQEFLDYAVNPFLGGVYACAPEDLCTRHALPRLWRLEQNHGSLVRGTIALMRAKRKSGVRTKTRLVSFRDGLETLPAALAAKLGSALQLRTEIVGVERVATSWRLTLRRDDANETTTADFDSILFTCGAAALSRLDVDGRQPLAALATLPWSSVTSLALGFRRKDVAHPLDGFGMLVPAKENRRILGALFSSTLFPGRAPDGHVLLTVFVGGRQPEHAALPDAELDALVLGELRELIGVRGEPVFRHCTRVPQAIPRYTVAFGALATAMDAFERDHPGLFIAGNCRTGISLADCMAAGQAAATRIGTVQISGATPTRR
jgi:oxygen-dependent protoporphyrinogen oxidase